EHCSAGCTRTITRSDAPRSVRMRNERCPGSFTRAKLQLPQLDEQFPAEDPKVFEVSLEKAARFLGEPVNPFGADALHPHRRAFDGAGKKINGRADTRRDRHAERTVVHGDPFFLLRTAE